MPVMSFTSPAALSAPSVLYLRLAPRAQPRDAASLPFALAARGRLQRVGHASLAELSAMLKQAQRVTLLLSASDVSLFRIAMPPLAPARLKAALPALVEDRVIGDPADCAIAAGPAEHGQRLVAVADRAWLQGWLDAVRAQGARRVAALPFSLCLPLPAGRIAASLVEHGGQRELALRLSAQEGMGLPLSSPATAAASSAAPVDASDAGQLAAEVFGLLSTFAAGRPVQLALPASLLPAFYSAYGEHAARRLPGESDEPAPEGATGVQAQAMIELREENWAAWVEGAGHVPVDLATAIVADEGDGPDWRRWRWPLWLAAALLLVNVIALNADWWQLRSEGLQLRESMERTFRRSYPNETLADPVAQLRQKLAASRQAAGEFAAGDFIALAASLGEAWSESGTDSRAIASLEYRDAVLQVRFKAGQQPALEAVRAALAARGLEASTVAGESVVWQIRSTR